VLWDKNMIGIHPDHLTIHINKALIDTKYACLEGLKLSSRNDNKSLNISALRLRWDEFLHPHDTLLTNM
jgi:hypothetical protein